jgi:hypothetical protein
MIEEKISRLTPDQQHEVEDFIDFLISRDSCATALPTHYHVDNSVTEPLREALPKTQMIFAEECPVAGHIDQEILPDYPEYGGAGSISVTREPERRVIIPRKQEKEPGKLLDWID